MDIDWDELRAVATDMLEHAYVPYSHYPVGAAALVTDGGLGLCAECGLVSNLAATGGGQLVAFVCVNKDGDIIMPCGRCRQLLYEFSVPGMLCWTVAGIRTIDEVLPDAFGPRDLEAVR